MKDKKKLNIDQRNEEFLKNFIDVNNGKSNHMMAGVLRLAKFSLIVSVLSIIGVLIFATRAISLASDQALLPLVVERDGVSGSVLNIGRVNKYQVSDQQDLFVMADLQDFIKDLRESSIDKTTMLRRRKDAQALIPKGSDSEQQLETWIGENDIYRRLADQNEYVIPTSFRKRKTSDNTYVLNWEEKVKDRASNRQIRREQWKAEVEITIQVSNDPEIFENNPLGIYITSLQTDLIETLRPSNLKKRRR